MKNAIRAVAAVAAFVFAFTAYGETWCYNVINGNEAELCCGSDCPAVAPEPTGALVVRSSINGYPVTSIGDRSFNNCWYMTSATLPDSVRNIGPSAFARCSALETVGGIENVTNIGNYAFYNCTSLKNIALGGNLKTIGLQAFRNCTRLTSVEVPDSVTSLDDYAFYSCEGLRTIKLGSKLKTIGQQAFRNCIGLTDVEVPDSVTSIGDYAFYGCSNLVHLSLPSRFDGSLPKGMLGGCSSDVKVFYRQKLGNQTWSYTVDDSDDATIEGMMVGRGVVPAPSGVLNLPMILGTHDVRAIGSHAFYNCSSITAVFIPYCISGIGMLAFNGCTALKSVTVGGQLQEIGPGAFIGCSSLETFPFADGLSVIGASAFTGCVGLTEITFPDSLEQLGNRAFSYCTGLKKVTFPRWFKDNLDASVFDGCPDLKITYYGDGAYTVRYRKYDGSGETASEDFECDKTYTLAWLGSELGWSRPGYEFCGWVPWNPDTKARLCKYDNGQPVRNLADAGETVNLYCGWKSSSSYRVCFHRCAGPDDLLKMNQVILRNKEDSLAWMDSMIGWKRDGYTFAGWDESEKATTVKYANGAKVKNLAMNGGTKHLYAVWRANADHKYPYKVKFYKYDGSGETRTQSLKAGTVQNLLWLESGLGWKRDGYEFCGWVPWNPDAKARLCKYVNGQKVVDLASKSGETINLYPAWKSSSSYRVCFNRNDGTGVKMNQVILRNKEDNLAWMDSMIGWKRDGYKFAGWAEKEGTSTVKYANGAKVKNLAMDGGTKHLYAIWKLAD